MIGRWTSRRLAKVVFGLVGAGATGAVVAACTSSDKQNSGPLPEAGMEAGTEAATDVLTDAAAEGAADAGTDADASGPRPWISPSCCQAFVAIPGDAGPVLTRTGPFCGNGLAAICSPPEASVPAPFPETMCAADYQTAQANAATVTCRQGLFVHAKDCGAYHVIQVTGTDASWESYFDKTSGALVAVTGASDLCLPNGGGYCIDCKGGPADFVPVVDCSAPRDLCAGADGGTDAATEGGTDGGAD